jgi:DNA polymerase I
MQEVKNKKISNEKLIIRTQLKKALEAYEAVGPHVTVARKMQEIGLPVKAGSLIEYIIAAGKERLIRERAKLPDEVKQGSYDVNYYIEHQILPAVESIFAVFGISLEQLKEGKRQKKLADF